MLSCGKHMGNQEKHDFFKSDAKVRKKIYCCSIFTTCCNSCWATATFGARAKVCAPFLSSNVTWLSSLPIASVAKLATIKGNFFASRLASAYSSKFSLSAAKPTQNGALGKLATSARISLFLVSAMVSV